MSDARTIEDRALDQQIRAWATDQGMDVKARGRIPDGVKIAWQAATGQDPGSPGLDAGLDLAEDLGAGDLDDSRAPEDFPGPGSAGPGAADGRANGMADPGGEDAAAAVSDGPPPPADLDEARARLGRTPRGRGWTGKPADKGKQQAQPEAPKPSRAPSKSLIADVEGKLVLLLGMPAVSLRRVDPVCGGVLTDNVKDIAKAWAPLICQSADLVRFFSSATLFMMWLAALQSLVPVAEKVYDHHFARGGGEQQQQQPAGGSARVPDQDLSQYAVPFAGHVPQPQAG